MKVINKVLIFSLLVFSLVSNLYASNQTIKTNSDRLPLNQDVKQFIDFMAKKYHFNRKKLTQQLEKAHYYKAVVQRISHPYEKKLWNFYKALFVTHSRVSGGVKYWQEHEKAFEKIKTRYGVDPSIIIAIIGIESRFGKRAGEYQELGALATLAFFYPPRAQFFKRELRQYLLLARKQNLPVLGLKGSYAGALGIPQFMPSSYLNYGVRLSGSTKADLINDHTDAIASIANYLRHEGWKPGQPIAAKAEIKKVIPNNLVSKSARPRYTLAKLKDLGIETATSFSPKQKAALIELKSLMGDQYYVTFANFRAIMNYNPSISYAMAVFLLSQKIKAAHDKQA